MNDLPFHLCFDFFDRDSNSKVLPPHTRLILTLHVPSGQPAYKAASAFIRGHLCFKISRRLVSCQQRPKILAFDLRPVNQQVAGASPEGRDLDEAAERRVLPFKVLFYHPVLLQVAAIALPTHPFLWGVAVGNGAPKPKNQLPSVAELCELVLKHQTLKLLLRAWRGGGAFSSETCHRGKW